ncbi:cytosolic 5'-nucleotidase 1A-like [Conger conger]|uniref:cytosolic 5'-nucleotidase 1A-like n=1 Tax=Conger conger TaxID=82655 RepID=UPI002A59BFA0|nr:cytosolic 5'-nucleotidase 1A-like [Conger conger]
METNKASNAPDDKGVGDGPAGKRGPMTIAVSEILLINMEKPGVAFPFIKALVNVNDHFHKLHPDSEFPFHIALMTKNQAQEQHIRNHLNKLGHAAAIMFPNDTNNKGDKSSVEKERLACVEIPPPSTDQIQLRVAFDGDNVLFSQDPESAKAIHGLESFKQNEDEKQDVPLREGPLKCFLEALVNMEKKFHAKHPNENCPVQTFLVTARNPVFSGTRVLKTLKSWGLELTQAFFLSGTPKGPPLSMIQPHIFFDDRKMHVNEGLELGVVSALVPYGIGYETDKEAKEEEANHGDKQGNSVSIN